MKFSLPFLCGAAALLCATVLPAATLIEQGDGESTMITYVEGSKVRSESIGQDGYAIMDYEKRTMFMINPAERKALDMSSTTWQAAETGEAIDTSGVDADLDRIGAGPEIAGYDTVHYVLKANGRKCEDIYASKAAYRDSGMDKFWNSENMRALQQANLEYADACELADYVVSDPEEIGFPLKTVDADGETMQVTRIEKNVKVPGSGFEVPEGYEVVEFNLAQMMGGVGAAMSEAFGGEGAEEASDDEEYSEEEYTEEDYDTSVEDLGEALEEIAEDEELGEKVKGFFKRFKKKDKDG